MSRPCPTAAALPAAALTAALTAALSAAFVPALAHAQDESGANLPLWEVGAVAFGVRQQAYPGSDQHVNRGLALPFVIYRGKYLRADRQTAGVRAVKTDDLELDIGFAGAFGSSSKDIDARRGMPDLGTLVEFGPRIKWKLGEAWGGRFRLDLPLRGVFDLSDGLAHRGWSLEPEIGYRRTMDNGWSWGTSVSAVIGDRRLNRTLYGVAPVYATADRPAYQASSGLVAWRLEGTLSSAITRDWRVFGFARLDTVSGAANRDSPLVRQTSGGSVGIGVAYTWLRSDARAYD